MRVEMLETAFGWSSKFCKDNILDIASDICVYHILRSVTRIINHPFTDEHSKSYVSIVSGKYVYCEIA